MNYSKNPVFYVKLETLTPVHIGAGTEKRWKKNFDFVVDNNLIKVYNLNYVLNNINLDNLTDELINDFNLEVLIINKNKNLKPQFQYQVNFPQGANVNEIFTFIRDGSGNPYIPGSSLKGAVRSVLLGSFIKNNPGLKKNQNKSSPETQVFGPIEEDVMRYIQFTDIYFNEPKLEVYLSKIYSLIKTNHEFEGGWKNSFKGADKNPIFNSFITFYECIMPCQTGYARVVINQNAVDLLREKNHLDIKQKYSVANNILDKQKLFQQINDHTSDYLKNELQFFESYKGSYSDMIINNLNNINDQVTQLKKQSNQNSCILHLGAGSGFHGITGDWCCQDHLIDLIDYKNGNRGKRENNNSAKTRKLLFTFSGVKVDKIYPFGFIKLSLISKDEYEKFLTDQKETKPNQETHQAPAENHYNVFSSSNNISDNIIETKTTNKTEEIKQISFPKIKSDATQIFAEVVESGKPNYVKLFITDYNGEYERVKLTGYSSELEVGKKLIVKVTLQKNQIIQARFEKFL